MTDPLRVAAVLLAAGASRRLGRPKPLVPIGGRPLARRMAEAAVAAGFAPLYAVLGAEAAAVERALAGVPASLVRNPGFEEGIASSIRAGVGAARELAPPCDGVLILLVDQPAVDAALLGRLRRRFEAGGGARAAACAYAGSVGAPAIFPAAQLGELLALRGDRGAKRVLDAHRAELLEEPFPEAALDVDTAEDLEGLTGSDPSPVAD